jgi:Flp pilus assembly pilin Flp
MKIRAGMHTERILSLKLRFSDSGKPRALVFSSRQKQRSTQSGQALIEYALLLVISVSLAITIQSFFNGALNESIYGFNAQLEKDLRTGGFPESANGSGWEN